MIGDDDSWWWALADRVLLSCCVVLSCVDLYWIVLTCIKLFSIPFPYTVYPNMWKSLVRARDDRWPIMLYWVVVLYWVMLTCIELCWLVVSYLALHFIIMYILICERALPSVLLVSLLVFRLRALSRQNVIFCNCIMKKEHSVCTHGSLLITTSSHETLQIISFWSFSET